MQNYITYMWREAPKIPKDNIYRYQTNDPEVNRRMTRRKDFKLVLKGLNSKFWVYKTKKYSLKEAKKTLSRVSHQEIRYIKDKAVFSTLINVNTNNKATKQLAA